MEENYIRLSAGSKMTENDWADFDVWFAETHEGEYDVARES